MKDDRYDVTRTYLSVYLLAQPMFLGLIRSAEAALYHPYLPLPAPQLDVGCGDGFFAKTVFGHLDVGLDVASSRIKEAREKDVYKRLVLYDGRIFPFKNNSFQTVVSNCVFEHIPDIHQLVREIFRVLQPGGKVIVTVMAKPWDKNLFGALVAGNIYRNYMRKKQVHLNLFTRKEWDSVFLKNRFVIDTRIGYMDKTACRIMDMSHYLSIQSLISYKLFGSWVLWPKLTKLYPISYLSKIMARVVSPDQSGAIFYVLEKPK